MGPSRTTARYLRAVDWAEGHLGVISLAELAALEVPTTTIGSWVRTGRLRRLHEGVFAVGHAALRPEAWWRAATLTCGPLAALSHHTAGLALGHWVPDCAVLHLTTTGEGRSREGLRIHRSPLGEAEVTTRCGLRVTRLERTLVDLADILDWNDLARVADRIWRIDVPALVAARERVGNRVGRRRSGLLIERERSHTRSELERAFLRFLHRHGLPRPSGLNEQVGRFVVDAVYAGASLVIELDGRAYHARRREMKLDRARDADLQLLGYRVLRLVWEDLYDEQAPETIRRLTGLLAAGPDGTHGLI